MSRPEPLASVVIHNSGTPIGLARDHGEAAFIKRQHDISVEQVERVLNVTIEED